MASTLTPSAAKPTITFKLTVSPSAQRDQLAALRALLASTRNQVS